MKAVEDPVSAGEGVVGITAWIEAGRSLGKGGEKGGFGEGKIGEGFVEKEVGCFGTALAMGAVVDSI